MAAHRTIVTAEDILLLYLLVAMIYYVINRLFSGLARRERGKRHERRRAWIKQTLKAPVRRPASGFLPGCNAAGRVQPGGSRVSF